MKEPVVHIIIPMNIHDGWAVECRGEEILQSSQTWELESICLSRPVISESTKT